MNLIKAYKDLATQLDHDYYHDNGSKISLIRGGKTAFLGLITLLVVVAVFAGLYFVGIPPIAVVGLAIAGVVLYFISYLLGRLIAALIGGEQFS